MSNKDKIIISVTTLTITGLIIVVGFLIWKGLPLDNKDESLDKEQDAKIEEENKKSFKRTQDLIDEIREIAKDIENREGGISKIVTVSGEEGEKKAVVIAPGSSPISMETGDVLTGEGEVAQNNVKAGSEDAPQASFVVNPEDLPESTIKLNVTWKSMTPGEFKVKKGQVVNLAMTATDKRSHRIIFEDPSLTAVVISLTSGKTKIISFNAPTDAGEYLFFSDTPYYREKGSAGKMIVE